MRGVLVNFKYQEVIREITSEVSNADLLSDPIDFTLLEYSLSRHDNLKRMAALFLLKVREEYELPLGIVEKLVGDFKGMRT